MNKSTASKKIVNHGGPFGFPLGFARGFGETGQAFSKSARGGAPSVISVNVKSKPALYFPVKMAHRPYGAFQMTFLFLSNMTREAADVMCDSPVRGVTRVLLPSVVSNPCSSNRPML